MTAAPVHGQPQAELWRALLGEREHGRRLALKQQLAASVAVGDLPRLVETYASGTDTERDAALGVLLEVSRRPGGLLGPELVGPWLDALKRTVREECPRTTLGCVSFRALIENARDDAEDFLRDLDLGTLSESELGWAVRTLGALRSAEALQRLEEISTIGGAAGERARDMLDTLGVVSRTRIAAIAQQWRVTRRGEALNKLYHVYINHLEEGAVSMQELLDLLGEPTRRLGGNLWYEADGAELFLESDDKGRLRGRKLS